MHPIVVHPELSNVVTKNIRKGAVTKAVTVIELLILMELSLTRLLSIKSLSIKVPLRLSKRLLESLFFSLVRILIILCLEVRLILTRRSVCNRG